jgi:hypothetical protein
VGRRSDHSFRGVSYGANLLMTFTVEEGLFLAGFLSPSKQRGIYGNM